MAQNIVLDGELAPPHQTRLKVAALIDTLTISGPGKQLVALAQALRPHGVDIHILLFRRSGDVERSYHDFVRDAGITCETVEDSFPFDLRLLRRVRKVLRSWQPAIVQTHNYRASAIARVLKLVEPWPWIGFFHGATQDDLKLRVYNWIDRTSLRGAERVVTMSAVQQRAMAKTIPHAQRIFNAILPPVDKPTDETEAKLRTAMNRISEPIVTVIGRLSREKGVDIFLHAFKQVRDAGHRVHALIVGHGYEETVLKELAMSLQLDAHVTFLGAVDPVEPVYEVADLVVIPSRSEGLPNVLLEALRANRQVVATSVGAVPEVIGETDAATVVPPNDPTALAQGMVRELTRTSVPPGRQTILKEFSLSARVDAHIKLYQGVLPPSARIVGTS